MILSTFGKDPDAHMPGVSEHPDSEERFRQIADSAPVLIWGSGVNALCDYFNKPWLDFTGRTFEQELGNGWAEGVHPDDIQHCLDIYLNSFHSKVPFQMEYRLRRKDGEYRWLIDNGIPRYSPDESFLGYISSCLDITERKQAEEIKRISEAFLNSIVENSPASLWISDQHGNLLRMNQACREILCIKDEEVVGIYNIFNDNIIKEQGFMQLVKDVFEKGEKVRFNLSYNTANVKGLKLSYTKKVDLDVNISPVLDPGGKVTNAIIQHLKL